MTYAVRQPANLGHCVLSTKQVKIRNLLCKRLDDIQFVINNLKVRCSLDQRQHISSAYAWVEAELGGYSLNFGLPWAAARRIVGVALEAATPEDAALLLEDGLTTVLDELEQQSGHTITFLRVVQRRNQQSNISADIWFHIESSNSAEKFPHRYRIPIEISIEAARLLSDTLARWQISCNCDHLLYLGTSIEIGGAVLTLAELESLQIGDAVLFYPDNRPARIIVEGQLAANAIFVGEHGQWSLATQFQPLLTGRDKFSYLNNSEENMSVPENLENTRTSSPALDEIDISLSVRFGKTVVSLGELRNAGVGTVFTLDRPDGTHVELVINDKVVGTGDLISVAGQRAVEVKTLFNEKHF